MPKTVDVYERMKDVDPDYMEDLENMSEEERLKAMGYDFDDEEEEEVDPEEEKEEEGEEDSGEDESEDEGEQGEDEEEGEEASEDDEEESTDKDDIRIPKARFDEAVQTERERRKELETRFKEQEERSRWLEEQLGLLIQNQQAPKRDIAEPKEVFDFEKAEADYIKALISGEDQEAAKLRSVINREQEKRYESRISQLEEKLLNKTTESYKRISDEDKLNLVLDNARNKFHQLDESHDDYDVDLANDIDALAQGYVARQKINLADAYQKAIDRSMKGVKKEETVAPSKEISKRKKAKAKKISSQPPKTAGSKTKEIDLDSLDVSKMTEEDFAKLSDKDISYLLNKA